MNFVDQDDDKLKKARYNNVSLHNYKDRIGILVIIGVICSVILIITSYHRKSDNTHDIIIVNDVNIQRRAPPSAIQKASWEGCLYELPTSDDEIVSKHIVPPPAGDVILVCCNTTKGVLNIEVHPSWAPRGADRFLNMVTFINST